MRVKHKKTKTFIAFVLFLIIIASGLHFMKWTEDTHQHMTAEEAATMMASDPSVIVLDVRRHEEYIRGHIPNAVLLPNEDMKNEARVTEVLPDKDRIILVYCQSGRRAENSASKLAHMGYKHVYEFGGLVNWTGSVVTGEP